MLREQLSQLIKAYQQAGYINFKMIVNKIQSDPNELLSKMQ